MYKKVWRYLRYFTFNCVKSQYVSEKERSENFAKDYNLLTRRFTGMVDQNTEYLKKVKILENELEVKILESTNLTEKIKGFWRWV